MKGFIKKSFAILTVLLISTGFMSAYATEPAFPDIAGHWGQSYIEVLAEKGIVSGMPDGLFHPNSTVTTAQFVTMIMQSGVGKIPPVDDHWASGYVKEAAEAEIIIGNDMDSLDSPLIRRFAARIALEALHKLWDEQDEQDIFSADKLIDLYSCNQCVWSTAQMYVKGIMIGMPDDMFHGDESFTRAEASVVIMRLIDPTLRVPQQIELPKAEENGNISPDEALRLVDTYQNVMLVDVRSAEDHAAGHIPNSVNVPLDDIINDVNDTQLGNARDLIVIVYCQKGSRSLQAYKLLKDSGFEKVYTLGGIDDWPYDIENKN